MNDPILKIYSLDNEEFMLFDSVRVKTGYENHLIYFGQTNSRADYILTIWELAELLSG